MADKCENCQEKCPMAEMAHNAARGRMYATNEFISLLKKVESGELVEVVRCKDCKYGDNHCDKQGLCTYCQISIHSYPVRKKQDDFCSHGERKSS